MKQYRIIFRKLLWKLFSRQLGKQFFVNTLRMEGFDIGDGTIIFSPDSLILDHERPWMIHIGKYCKIALGTTILTHDYSRSVLRRKYKEVIGEAGEVIIGDNVFIGVQSIILMGSHIGNNVIIGAGSVVSGTIPDNVVVAGNPAKIIRTLEIHYEIRKNKQLREMVLYFSSYKKRYGVYPPPNACGPFWYLFENRITFDYDNDPRLNVNGDNRSEFAKDLMESQPYFHSYEELLKYVEANE